MDGGHVLLRVDGPHLVTGDGHSGDAREASGSAAG